MINESPLIDIKPYNPHFDAPKNIRIGWMSKYFKDIDISNRVAVKSEKEWLHEK